ncbi:MAG TPA: NAD-dependent epimerase/dehydratase family protein [Ktedonobacterales bacterium]
MRIVVLGGSGLIGSKLVHLLRQQGQDVVAASHASELIVHRPSNGTHCSGHLPTGILYEATPPPE